MTIVCTDSFPRTSSRKLLNRSSAAQTTLSPFNDLEDSLLRYSRHGMVKYQNAKLDCLCGVDLSSSFPKH